MSALKDVLKAAASSKKSSKSPTFYNREKKLFVDEMALHIDPVVRIAAGGSDHIPSNTLSRMLQSEEDSDVLHTILMNPRTPVKGIKEFIASTKAKMFEDDEEIVAFLQERIVPNESEED